MLEANEALTWRDVQDILIRTATKTDQSNGDWITNAAGLNFNHNYGAGLVDAGAAVQAAFEKSLPTSELLGPQAHILKSRFFDGDASNPNNPSGIIPDNTGAPLLIEFDMTGDFIGNSFPSLRTEHVELNATLVTDSRSELEIVVISPNGTQSILQETNPNNTSPRVIRWNFSTVRNWGEQSAGTWFVRITDKVSGNVSVMNTATLRINGSVDLEIDRDGDGYSDYQEYLFGGNASTSDIPKHLPKLVSVDGNDFVEYGVDTSREELDYIPQESSDLTHWNVSESAILERTEGVIEVYRIPIIHNEDHDNFFYRVLARTK